MNTEDFANILLKFSNGALGNLSVSQVATGRKNSIRFEIYGTERSAWWDSEEPNVLHYGSRDGANISAQRAAAGLTDTQGFSDYPPGHAEGFPDTFKMLYRAVYSEIAGSPTAPRLYATALDGHHEMQFCDAILKSHRTQQWQSV